jgi:hypothetical protein
MMPCEQIREWLPWYVTGSIDLATAEQIAQHLRDCETCRSEFVETAQLRHRFAAAITEAPSPGSRAWRQLGLRLGGADTVNIDLGSFLIGLRIGVAAHDRRTPVRGDLRIWGRNVRIIGRKKGA